MIDTHIHLDQYDINTLDDNIKHWKKEGIKQVVAVSMNLQSARNILSLKRRFGRFVLPAIGYHPEQPIPSEEELNEIKRLIQTCKNEIAAIGEVGLPYYERDKLFKQYKEREYISLLEEFLQLSKECDLPVVLHAVHDTAEVAFNLLKEYQIKKAHFHWLKAPMDVVEKIIEEGYYISVTPEVCYRKRDQILAQAIPLEQLLIETDGPWPYDGPFKNLQTSPLLLKEICHFLENIKNKKPEDIKFITANNAKKLYDSGGRQ